MDGGNWRDGKRREVDVVEADDRNIFGHAEPGFVEDGHGAHGGSVVIGEESGEGAFGGQERLGGNTADVGSVWDIFELKDEFRIDREIEFGGNFLNGLPARNGIGTGGRSAKKGDMTVAQF